MQHQTRVAYAKEVGSALPPTSPHASRAEALRVLPPCALPRAMHVANATASVAHVLAPDTHHDPSTGITRAWCKGDGASVGARYSTARGFFDIICRAHGRAGAD